MSAKNQQRAAKRRRPLSNGTSAIARTAFGIIITAIWIGLASLQVEVPWANLLELDSAGLLQLLGANAASLAFFWLVLGYCWLALGYFGLRTDLRRSLELIDEAAARAETAMSEIEVERQKFRDYEEKRIRSARPQWVLQGCIGHKNQHEMIIRNTGGAALRIRAFSHSDARIAIVLSNGDFVGNGEHLVIKVMFPEERLEEFAFRLEYYDCVGEEYMARIVVSEMEVEVEHEDVAALRETFVALKAAAATQ